MKLKNILAFLIAGGVCFGGAYVAANWIEEKSETIVAEKLAHAGNDWASVRTDGLQIILTGVAPDEATRFRVVSLVGSSIDPDRIVDEMDVEAPKDVEAPRFSVEMLRNDDGISLIGLIPAEVDRAAIASSVEDLTSEGSLTDMLETAEFAKPEGWDVALEYALDTLRNLPRSKISVSADHVVITAISDSPQDKRRIETELARNAPDGMRLELNISAPRPVITPFTLRFKLADGVASFDACSAPNEKSQSQILRAAVGAGLTGQAECRIGLGVPTPRWGDAVEISIAGLSELGGGSLTFSDADITLVASDNTSQSSFDRVVGDLDAMLPEVFSLHAVLPEKVVVDGTGSDTTTIPEFVATRSPEGSVQLRGRLPDDGIEQIVGSYARAQFGTSNVYLATRDDAELPESWPIRVLAGLEALSTLASGSVIVQEEYLEIKGLSGRRDASEEVSRILADKLGESENFEISVRYDELLDPTLNIPTPQECVERINKILALSKITFEPSSADLTEAAGSTIDQIADVARLCRRVQMEIGGHTDSQGREIMNLDLSQDRAESVLNALLERDLRVRNLSARGYGETQPIAENDSEAGREANRRIEFRLLTDVRAARTEEDLQDAPQSGETEAATPQDDTTQDEETTQETEDSSEQN